MIKKGVLEFFLFIFFTLSCGAQISFNSLDLNSSDELLFTVTKKTCDAECSALFKTTIQKNSTDQNQVELLTCYPKEFALTQNNSVLQIRNTFGTFLYNYNNGNFIRTQSEKTNFGNILPVSISPDGNWKCYIEKTKNNYGSIVLKNLSTNKEYILSEKTPVSFETVPVKWSPDSSVLVYEKNNSIYFCNPQTVEKNILIPESFKKICNGKINSINFTNQKGFIFIDGDIVYSVRQNELFTRALFSKVVGKGTIEGRIPFNFSNDDDFFVDPNGDSFVLVKDKKVAYHFSLLTKNNGYCRQLNLLNFVNLDGTVLDYNIFWKKESDYFPAYCFKILKNDSSIESQIIEGDYRNVKIFNNCKNFNLIPDGIHFSFVKDSDKICILSPDFKVVKELSFHKIISYIWNKKVLIVGTESEIIRIDFKNFDTFESSEKVIMISGCKESFWDNEKIIALCGSNNKQYALNQNGSWSPIELDLQQKNHSVQNQTFRVFTSTCPNRNYSNAIFVRVLNGKINTFPLFAITQKEVKNPKRIGIAVECMENAEGIANIISVSKDYNIPVTFFLNGEFIRRYPRETNQIASSGFAEGSLFFTLCDLTDPELNADSDFIKRGLARNEDEYFLATGKELELLWHAPFYHQSRQIIQDGEEAGYKYVKAFTAYSDRITSQMQLENPQYLCLDSHRLIDATIQSVQDEEIISVTAGKVPGTRPDYLYQNFLELICTLIESGFEIVPVSELIK